MKRYLALVRLRPQFRRLWLAQVISLTGDWFNVIASIILINRYTDSTLAVGGLFLARALPPFLMGPLAGVVADRFSRKKVLIISDLLRAFIVLGFLLVNGPEQVWLLYVLSVIQFVVSAFFEPARSAIVPSLVASDELLTANTLSSTTWSAMVTIGAAIGGVTAAAFGPQVALVIDALSFAASALLVWRIKLPPSAGVPVAHGNGWADFLAGLGYVRRHPSVSAITLVKAMGQMGSVDVMAAAYARRVFHIGQDGAVTLGLMLAAFGVGAVIGPLLGNLFHDQSARMLRRAIAFGYAIVVLGWLVLGLSPSLAWVLAGCLLRGVGGSLNWTYSDVLLQMSVPNHFLGRVFALDLGLFTLAMSASVWLNSLALDRYALEPRTMAMILAAISIGPFIFWTMALRPLRRAEYASALAEMLEQK
jgi:MFS family permease